jgi:hypothetical protein
MTDDLPETDLQREDAAILAGAIALLWSARPALASGPFDAQSWWQAATEPERRISLYRARVVVEAWCKSISEQGGKAESWDHVWPADLDET